MKTFEEVSGSLVNDLVKRVFGGSKEQLLVSLFGDQQKLSRKDRAMLENLLEEQDQ